MRVRLLVLVLFSIAPSGEAQVAPTVSASARFTEVRPGPADPELWLGGRLEWHQPRWQFLVATAGGRGWRGRWGGEASLVSRFSILLGDGADLSASLEGAAERPVGSDFAGELRAKLGIGKRWGAVSVQGGALALGQALTRRAVRAGGYFSTEINAGSVLLSGDVGQLSTLAGSAAAQSFAVSDPFADTLAGSPSARRLSHALVAARLRSGPLEVSATALRRSRLELGANFGWEVGIAVGPVAGGRLRLTAGRMPAPRTIYLPYRKRLSVGVELAPNRPWARTERPPPAGFEVRRGSEPGISRVVVRHPSAGRVELAGDFSDWEPIELLRVSPGLWATSLRLSPGTHQLNVRFDGGRWEVPAGLPAQADEFGGEVGVLVVGAH